MYRERESGLIMNDDDDEVSWGVEETVFSV